MIELGYPVIVFENNVKIYEKQFIMIEDDKDS